MTTPKRWLVRLPFFRLASCFLVSTVAISCRPSLPPGPIDVTYALLVRSSDDGKVSPGSGAFRVTGLSSRELTSLERAALGGDAWQSLLRVSVLGQDGPPMSGQYEVAKDAVVFRPAFPLDPGRRYQVRFDPARLVEPRQDELVEKTIALPVPDPGPATFVAGLWPSAATWPENLLRFYIHFSAPMAHTSAVGRVRLEDDTGQEIKDALLPMDLDLWNGDYTRYTVFFDPGRVKRGIRPNRELGRALVAGRQYAIVIDADWRDGRGQPLKSTFRQSFTAGPELTRAIDPRAWQIAPPRRGTRDPLVVSFPWPLDRALLRSAVGVARGQATPFLRIDGDVEVEPGDERWRFIPRSTWEAGVYDLVALSILEDPAGNAVGRAFEIDMFKRPGGTPVAEDVRVPFKVD